MRTEDEEILQKWIPKGDIETRFFNYENMIAFAKHYKKLKEGQALPLVDVSPSEHEFKAALRLLIDLANCQNGAPLEQHRKEWEEVMQSTYEFLDAHGC